MVVYKVIELYSFLSLVRYCCLNRIAYSSVLPSWQKDVYHYMLSINWWRSIYCLKTDIDWIVWRIKFRCNDWAFRQKSILFNENMNFIEICLSCLLFCTTNWTKFYRNVWYINVYICMYYSHSRNKSTHYLLWQQFCGKTRDIHASANTNG